MAEEAASADLLHLVAQAARELVDVRGLVLLLLPRTIARNRLPFLSSARVNEWHISMRSFLSLIVWRKDVSLSRPRQRRLLLPQLCPLLAMAVVWL